MSKKITMDDLLKDADIARLQNGDVVEGVVLSVHKHEVWVDIGARGVGVVSRKELGYGTTTKEGDTVTASVIDPETKQGHALLSLRRAAKDKGWEDIVKMFEDGETVTVKPYDANRGGLLVELDGVRGFLPVSQLSADNYPRVSSADKDEILQKLHGVVGKELRVRILDANKKENKLIFSEKEALKEDVAKRFAELKEGDTVKGVVTGVIDFGAFVNVGGIEGLIHISEISWERIEDPRNHIKVGEEVEAKIVAIDKERLSLSIKQLSDDPWLQEVEKLPKGTTVKGSVTRITPFGAFVQISPSVEALVHISEMAEADEQADPEKVFKLGETKEFTVLDVDKDGRKIALSMK
ncbi:MAG: S1 RNA-binding domain-containing protein [Patescibacteria group bacterium]